MRACVHCVNVVTMQRRSRHGSVLQQQQQQSEHSTYRQQQPQQQQLSTALDSLAISSSGANNSSAQPRQRHHSNGGAVADMYTTNSTTAANNNSMITTPTSHHHQLHRGSSVNALSVGSANVHMSSNRHSVAAAAAAERDTKLLRDMVAVTVQDSVASLRDDLQQDIRGLHLDLLRQFADQQEEISGMLKGHTATISNLISENEALRRENAELKRFY
jgi:hypothetical protein